MTSTEGAEPPPAAHSLLAEARAVAVHSYHPHSNYLVGAAVRTTEGLVFSGCFMENASFGMTICAEPAAVLAANSAGHRNLSTVAIVGGAPDHPAEGEPCTPCGRCRQILWEMALLQRRDLEVYCANLAMSRVLTTSVEELLPHPWPARSW